MIPLSFLSALLAGAALAEGGRITVADGVEVGAAWAMQSTDAYLGTRIGCYEGLTRIGHDLLVAPALARSWERIDDTRWVFHIREGVRFQDGTPLDAAAVAGALNHVLNASVPARAFSRKVIASVEATGPMAVTVTTVVPLVGLPGRLGAPSTSILAPAAYGGQDDIDPVGHCTGPFRITQLDEKQFVRTTRFDDYWGGPAKLEGADYLFVPDPNTRATMVRTGEAQIARLVTPAALPQIEADEDLAVLEVKAPRVLEMLLNNARPPFDNVKVRQAVRAAIDVTGIAAAVYEGLATPAGDAFRDEEPWAAADAPVIRQDMDRARALFEEAGVDPNGLELKLLAYNSKPALKSVAEIAQAMLGELGIKVTIVSATYNALEGDMLGGNYDIAMMSRGYLTDVPEPIGFLSADYSCEGSFNISQHCNPEIDAKLSAAAGLENAEARYAAYAEIAQYLYDEAVTIYVVNETVHDAASTSVTGYAPHPLNYTVVTKDTALD